MPGFAIDISVWSSSADSLEGAVTGVEELLGESGTGEGMAVMFCISSGPLLPSVSGSSSFCSCTGGVALLPGKGSLLFSTSDAASFKGPVKFSGGKFWMSGCPKGRTQPKSSRNANAKAAMNSGRIPKKGMTKINNPACPSALLRGQRLKAAGFSCAGGWDQHGAKAPWLKITG